MSTDSSDNPPSNPHFLSYSINICQNRSCKKQGAEKILAAFQASPIPGVEIIPSSCFGQCGNGPMILIQPDFVWYCGVQEKEVPLVVEQHLIGGKRVTQMLYHRFHPQK
jgi:(2Fe-2S) ferredoxin